MAVPLLRQEILRAKGGDAVYPVRALSEMRKFRSREDFAGASGEWQFPRNLAIPGISRLSLRSLPDPVFLDEASPQNPAGGDLRSHRAKSSALKARGFSRQPEASAPNFILRLWREGRRSP